MLAIFFILGLIVGSFLNVVVYRINIAESFVVGRSKCPHCKAPIRWYDNIPLISFILLRFRCRDCKKKISWQYPLVEFFTGALFVLVGMNFFVIENMQSWLITAYFFGIVSFLIIIFVYDFLYMEIPDIIIWVAVFWTVAFNLFFDWGVKNTAGALNVHIYSGVLAAIIAFSLFLFLVVKSKEKWMGIGDAYLVIFLGLVLGWPNIVLALFLAFSLGAIVGLIMVAVKKKDMKSPVPFAPFLVLGTIIAIFWGGQIIDWYWNLL